MYCPAWKNMTYYSHSSSLFFWFITTDKSTLSVSSGTGDDCLERGRGKRERKPKIHFDVRDCTLQTLSHYKWISFLLLLLLIDKWHFVQDIIFPLKPDTKVRRLRIMRNLGLIPPVGSPFWAPLLSIASNQCRLWMVYNFSYLYVHEDNQVV